MTGTRKIRRHAAEAVNFTVMERHGDKHQKNQHKNNGESPVLREWDSPLFLCWFPDRQYNVSYGLTLTVLASVRSRTGIYIASWLKKVMAPDSACALPGPLVRKFREDAALRGDTSALPVTGFIVAQSTSYRQDFGLGGRWTFRVLSLPVNCFSPMMGQAVAKKSGLTLCLSHSLRSTAGFDTCGIGIFPRRGYLNPCRGICQAWRHMP